MRIHAVFTSLENRSSFQTYWNLLEKVAPRDLKLTRLDDEIFEDTLKTFPELSDSSHEKLVKLDEDWMKSAEGKERWRKFIESYVVELLYPLHETYSLKL